MKYVIPICLMLCACAQTAASRLSSVRSGFARDDFVATAATFADNAPIESQNNLQLLITGDALYQAADFTASDNAFEIVNKRVGLMSEASVSRGALSLVAGEMATEYAPSMMDMLFVSYYQIWDAIGRGKISDARVIINQSYARQQKMSQEYAALIKKNQENANSAAMDALNQDNAKWTAYSDIMNPALMYLAGIVYLCNGEFANARDYLGRANGMAPENTDVARDMELAAKNARPTDTTWVFVETGFAPALKPVQINLLWIVGGGLSFIPIATTEPVFLDAPHAPNGAQMLADVDAMFMTEYSQYRINSILRTAANAVARGALQATMYNSRSNMAPLMGLAATIYSYATTNPDVRTWATLPKYIYSMRYDKSGLIEIAAGGNLIYKYNAAPGNHLIYIRMTGGAPIVHTFDF